MKVTRNTALIALLVLAMAAPLAAQSTQQPPAKQPATPATPAKQPGAEPPAATPAAPPVNPEEEAAFKAFSEGKDATLVAKLGEDFVTKYPESRYKGVVLTILTQSYFNTQQFDKVSATGEKALAFNPDNMDALTILCWTMARTTRPDQLDAAQRWEKGEKYGKRAVELLSSIPKPEKMTDEDFKKVRDDGLSRAYSGLGIIHWRLQRYADAVPELEQAVKLVPDPDPTDIFLYGVVLKATKHYAEASDAFGKCGTIAGPFQDACKKEQEANKKLAEANPAPPKQP
jgi:tetratricopeptide (TPR) repeat protein